MSFSEKYMTEVSKIFPEYADAKAAKTLEAVANCLTDVGSKMNLTAITEDDKVLWLHVIDSLHTAKAVQRYKIKNLADVGSGGGFPALPVGAVLSDINITAIDSTSKKCEYINFCAEACGIMNVHALCSRAEEYGCGEGREVFDGVCARAVAALPVLLELCIPLVKTGGYFFAMKGSRAEEELAEAEAGAKLLGCELCDKIEYSLGEYADKRYILIYRKTACTPSAYPRQYSKILKKPL